MQFTNLSDKYSTAIADPTTNLILYFEPCYHFTSNNNYFETGRSVVPYLVNVSLNVILALVTTVANTLVLLAIRKKYLLAFAVKTITWKSCCDRSRSRYSRSTNACCLLCSQSERHYSIHTGLCILIDYHRNKLGPVHRINIYSGYSVYTQSIIQNLKKVFL